MFPTRLNKFKNESLEKLDMAILIQCGVKLGRPEYLWDVLYEICKEYYRLEKEEEF